MKAFLVIATPWESLIMFIPKFFADVPLVYQAHTQAGQIGAADLIIIFIKAPHTQNAVRGMEPLMKDETIALTLQNGLGNQEAIEGVLGKGRILIGITSAGALLIAPGRVRHTGGEISISESPKGRSHLGQNQWLKSSLGRAFWPNPPITPRALCGQSS
jgi:ketopantoate reductase